MTASQIQRYHVAIFDGEIVSALPQISKSAPGEEWDRAMIWFSAMTGCEIHTTTDETGLLETLAGRFDWTAAGK